MGDCIFCKIIEGDIPANMIYENDNFIAFHDIHPKTKIHVLIIPKKHIPTLIDIQPEDQLFMGELFQVIQDVTKELNMDQKGFRLVSNCKEDGGQEVYHIHFHVLGGEKLSV